MLSGDRAAEVAELFFSDQICPFPHSVHANVATKASQKGRINKVVFVNLRSSIWGPQGFWKVIEMK